MTLQSLVGKELINILKYRFSGDCMCSFETKGKVLLSIWLLNGMQRYTDPLAIGLSLCF